MTASERTVLKQRVDWLARKRAANALKCFGSDFCENCNVRIEEPIANRRFCTRNCGQRFWDQFSYDKTPVQQARRRAQKQLQRRAAA